MKVLLFVLLLSTIIKAEKGIFERTFDKIY